MSITWADVEAIAPELATVPLATQSAVLADVDLQVDPDVWESKADLGRKYLAAHLGAITTWGSDGSLVTSESVGDVSRSFSSVATGGDPLEQTSYGIEYLRLLNSLVLARWVVA